MRCRSVGKRRGTELPGTYFRQKERLNCLYYTIATAEKQGDHVCCDVSGGVGQNFFINEHNKYLSKSEI